MPEALTRSYTVAGCAAEGSPWCCSGSRRSRCSAAAAPRRRTRAAPRHRAPPPGATTVTLSLAAGSENLNATACGKQEPFEHYAAPAQVHYTGTVSPAPSGRYKVKLKLELCNGKGFVDAGSRKIVGQTSGRYDGVFPISKPGYYSLRTTLESGSRPQSPKQYLKVG